MGLGSAPDLSYTRDGKSLFEDCLRKTYIYRSPFSGFWVVSCLLV